MATKLCLLSGTLLQIAGIQGQALGWSLASLVVARRQLWLSQTRVPYADKVALLDASIFPEIYLWASRGGDPAEIPPGTRGVPVVGSCVGQVEPLTQTVTRTVPVPTALLGDLRHCLQGTTTAYNKALSRDRGNAGHGQPTHQRPRNQFQGHCPRQPPQTAPPQSQQPQQSS
ncbi:UNVERIFIED_CONTAM: hypothetical protein FKN15_041112 [Acipenser sinensis]